MHKIESFKQLARTILAGLSSVAAVWLTDALNPYSKNVSRPGLMMLVAVIVMIAVVVIGVIADYFIEHSSRLRRVLLRGDSIEGTWFDISQDKETGQLLHLVIFQIAYTDGRFLVSGSSYNASGVRIAQWDSSNACCANHTLIYVYESLTTYKASNDPNNNVERGFAELKFGAPPNQYVGYYYAFDGRVGSFVRGERVKTEYLRRFNNLRDEDSRMCFASEKLTDWQKAPKISVVPLGRTLATRRR